jgi:hypothetical protein
MQQIPYVAFKVNDPALAEAREVAQILAERLRKSFGTVRVKRNWTIVHWRIDLAVKEDRFTLLLKRYGNGLWSWLVAPREFRVQSDSDTPILQVVCREVHDAIVNAPSISAVRWYFKDLATQTDAVATPDDLPWMPDPRDN